MKLGPYLTRILFTAVFYFPVLAIASENGIPNYHLYETGSQSCHACHTPPDSAPANTLSIIGNNSVSSGSTNSYTLTLNIPDPQPVLAAGFNLATDNGVLTATDTSSSIINSELVHNIPKTVTDIGSGYQVSWNFDWTAPALVGTTTINACGLPVNGDGLEIEVCTRHCGGAGGHGGPPESTSDGLTACTSFTININQPPVADAGNNQTVYELTAVSLDASLSSDDISITSYLWEQLSGTTVSLANANTSLATFTSPAVTTTEQLVFRLTVTDNTGLTDTADVSVFVQDTAATNLPPVANAGIDQSVTENVLVNLDASSSTDPEDTVPTSYFWEQISGINTVSLSSNSAIAPTFTAPTVNVDGDVITLKLTVTDSQGLESSDTIAITINNADAPPVASITDYSGTVITAVPHNSTITLYGSFSSDPDGPITAYNWIQTAGPAIINPGSNIENQFTFTTPDNQGSTIDIELTVTGDDGVSQNQITASLLLSNLPPLVDAGIPQTVLEGETVYLTSTISDPNNDVQSILWQQINCNTSCITLMINDQAQISFVAPDAVATSTMDFQVTVTDSAATPNIATDTISITVNDNGINQYPDDVTTFYSYNNEPMAIQLSVIDPLISASITNLQPFSSDIITDTNNAPDSLLYDLLGVGIAVDTPAASVVLTLHFPEAIPEDGDFYQYIPGDGWINNSEPRDFNNLVFDATTSSWVETSEQVTFNADRTIAYITITDGGPSDADGLANGVIIYRGGAGINVEQAVQQNGAGGSVNPLTLLCFSIVLVVTSRKYKIIS